MSSIWTVFSSFKDRCCNSQVAHLPELRRLNKDQLLDILSALADDMDETQLTSNLSSGSLADTWAPVCDTVYYREIFRVGLIYAEFAISLKPRLGLQIMGTRMGFPCPFQSVAIDCISLVFCGNLKTKHYGPNSRYKVKPQAYKS